MANVSMDTLMIEIQSSSKNATSSIQSLINKLKTLNQSLEQVVKQSENFSKLKSSITNVTKGINIPKSTTQSKQTEPKINMDKVTPTDNMFSGLTSQSTVLSKQGSLLANYRSQLQAVGLTQATLGEQISQTTRQTTRGTTETTKYQTALGQLATVTKQTRNGLTRYSVTVNQTNKANRTGESTFKSLNNQVKDINDSLKDLKKNSAGNMLSGLTTGVTGLIAKIGILWTGISKVATSIGNLTMQAASYYESLNLFTTTLGEKAQEGMDWVNMFSDALYLDPSNVMQYMGTFDSLIEGLGVGADDVYLMSQQLTQLTYDLASFKNLDFQTAFEKLRSGIAGELEPLRSVGVALSDATLQELAYSLGIEKSTSAMIEAEKVQLRYIQIMKSSTDWQADMGKTLMSPANAIRILKEQFTLLGRAIGNVFIPIVMALVPIVMVVTEALTWLANVIADFVGNIFGFKLDFSMDTGGFDSGVGDITSGLEEIGDTADKTKNKLNTMLAPFDELNNVQTKSKSTGAGAGDDAGLGGDLGVDLPTYDALSKLTDEFSSKIDGLKAKFGELGVAMSKIWNSTPIQSFVGALQTVGYFVEDLVLTIGESAYNNIITTWNNIKGNVTTGISNLGYLWTSFWTELDQGIQTWGGPIVEHMNGLFNSVWTEGIDPALQLISEMFSGWSETLVSIWDEHGNRLINNILEFVDKTIQAFQKIWDEIIAPIIQPFLDDLQWLWDEHLSKMISKVGDFIGTLVNSVLEIYNKWILPIVDLLTTVLSPVISQVAGTISGVMTTVWAFISDKISAVMTIFTGLIDFITGVFTGNWSRAWNGVKSIFKGIFDGLVNIVKTPINLIIDVINGFIRGLNRIKVPKWVPSIGGKGINIPTIPKFEDGGYPDSDLFLANENGIPEMVGRIGNQTAVANNDQITDAISNAVLRAINNSNFGNNSGGPTTIYIGNKKVYEGFGDHVQRENDRYGTNMIRI